MRTIWKSKIFKNKYFRKPTEKDIKAKLRKKNETISYILLILKIFKTKFFFNVYSKKGYLKS